MSYVVLHCFTFLDCDCVSLLCGIYCSLLNHVKIVCVIFALPRVGILFFTVCEGLCVLLIVMGLLIRPLRPVLVVMKTQSRASLFNPLDRSSSPMDMSIFRVAAAADTDSMARSSFGRSILGNMPQTHPTIEHMVQDMDV